MDVIFLPLVLEDNIAGSIGIHVEVDPRSLELIKGTIRNEFNLKKLAEVAENDLHFLLPLPSNALLVQLLQDRNEAFIDLMVPCYDFFKRLGFIFLHHFKEFSQILIVGLSICFLD
jgi:hypothetical protein